MSAHNGSGRDEATFTVKAGLAEMLKGGVIMDVVTAEQAKIAEEAGAAAVMALERVPADIRRDGGVARMSDPGMVQGIQAAVTIPVMAKARIGHFVEAQVLEALEVDYIDESEVLTPADEANHIDKWAFRIPFVCGATNLGEALRRIGEGAAMIRSKGEAGTGDIVEAVRHLRKINGDLKRLGTLDDSELATAAKELGAPLHLVRQVAADGRLPVVLFCAGGIATPADAALVMQLGAEGVFVGSGIFKSEDPERRARAISGPRADRGGFDWARPANGQPRNLQVGIRAAALPARLVAAWGRGAANRRAWPLTAARLRPWSASSPCRAGSQRTQRSWRAWRLGRAKFASRRIWKASTR
jgi:pyridoxal 5'-phosphate synthase pdxS subunit